MVASDPFCGLRSAVPASSSLMTRHRNGGYLENIYDIARIHAGIHHDRRQTGDLLSGYDSPLNRRGAAVRGQYGSVQVDAAEPRDIQHFLRQYPAVGDHRY